MKKYFSEFLGTAILVFFGCGTAAIAGSYVGTLGIAIAFGLGLIIAATLVGNISGAHINPAVSLAFLLQKKLSLKDFIGYVIAQILGAICGAFLVMWIITSANIGSIESVGLGTNGFEKLSSVNLSLGGAFLVETVLTFVFVLTVIKATSDKKKASTSVLLIGLALTLVHIIGIPLTGTSVNPARSLGPAILMGGKALKQVWLFIVAPLLGSVIAVIVNNYLLNEKKEN